MSKRGNRGVMRLPGPEDKTVIIDNGFDGPVTDAERALIITKDKLPTETGIQLKSGKFELVFTATRKISFTPIPAANKLATSKANRATVDLTMMGPNTGSLSANTCSAFL